MSGTMLVIVDAPKLGQLFQDVLSAEGYSVDYTDAHHFNLQKIEQAPPNLIVFDFAVGAETRGWQLLQMLKLHRATATLPALICTRPAQTGRGAGRPSARA